MVRPSLRQRLRRAGKAHHDREKMKALFLFLSLITLYACAMQDSYNPTTYSDLLPAEIREETFKFLASQGDIIENMKKIFESSPAAQSSPMLAKNIISYAIAQSKISDTYIQFITDDIKQFSIFKNYEFQEFIKKEYARIHTLNETFINAHIFDNIAKKRELDRQIDLENYTIFMGTSDRLSFENNRNMEITFESPAKIRKTDMDCDK
jgi:hypothetical protein